MEPVTPAMGFFASQWRFDDRLQDGVFGRAKMHSLAMIEALDALRERVAHINADPDLSDAGKARLKRRAVEETLAPVHAKIEKDTIPGVESTILGVEAGVFPEIDPTDAAAAILRMDLRSRFANLRDFERKALLNESPSIALLQALDEVPEGLRPKLPEGAMDAARRAVIAKEHPDLSARLDDLSALHNVMAGLASVAVAEADQIAGGDSVAPLVRGESAPGVRLIDPATGADVPTAGTSD